MTTTPATSSRTPNRPRVRDGTDGRVPGVPRQVSGAAKRVVASVVALAAILVVAGGLRAMQVRQQREADDARDAPGGHGRRCDPSAPAWPVVTPTASARRHRASGHERRAGVRRHGVRGVARRTRSTRTTWHSEPPVDVPPLPARDRAGDADRRARCPRSVDREPGEPRARARRHRARAQPRAPGRGREPGRRRRVAHPRGRLPVVGRLGRSCARRTAAA